MTTSNEPTDTTPQGYSPAPPTEPIAYSPLPDVAPVASAVPQVAPELLETAPAEPAPRKRRARWLWPTLAAVSLTGMAGLSVYLAVVAFQWSDQVDKLTVISTDLGATVTDATTERDAAVAERDAMAAQLEAAKARITELANEEANAKDSESVLIEYVDAMRACSDQRAEIIRVLLNKNLVFEGTTPRAVEAETAAQCDQIASDFDAYKAELGQ